MLIQFAGPDDNIQGTLDLASLDAAKSHVASQHVGFKGTITTGHIALTFEAGSGFSTALSGTIGPSTLVLNIPDATTGDLVTTTLRPGTTAEYTKAVDGLRAEVASSDPTAYREGNCVDMLPTATATAIPTVVDCSSSAAAAKILKVYDGETSSHADSLCGRVAGAVAFTQLNLGNGTTKLLCLGARG